MSIYRYRHDIDIDLPGIPSRTGSELGAFLAKARQALGTDPRSVWGGKILGFRLDYARTRVPRGRGQEQSFQRTPLLS